VLYSLNYGFIDEARFQRRFGITLAEAYPRELDFAVNSGLLKYFGNRWQLAPNQFYHKYVAHSLFYPDAAKAWLMTL